MAETDVSIVVGRLTDLLAEETQLHHRVPDEIQHMVTELRRMVMFLPEADSRIDEARIYIWLQDVRDLAYDAERVVLSFLNKGSSTGKEIQWLKAKKLSRKLKDIEKKLSFFFQLFDNYNIKSTLDRPESSNSSYRTVGKLERLYAPLIAKPEIFVGSPLDVDRLVGHLVDESDARYPVISICGMGGLGKTTLAQKICYHSTLTNHFDRVAWVSIWQGWKTELGLQKILASLAHMNEEDILKMDDADVIKNLIHIQETKRCLIVLDDICSTEVWDSMKAAFKAENSRSKLMLTSRKFNVADYVNPRGFIHEVDILSAEESWELLNFKALAEPSRYFPGIPSRDLDRMQELGREMVKRCGGIPLAIVMLAGILPKKPTMIEWEKVYRDSLLSLKWGKNSFGDTYEEQLSETFHQSYKDLAPQLRPFFQDLGFGPISFSRFRLK